MVKLFNATTLVLTTLSYITGLSGPKGVAVNSAGTLIYVVSVLLSHNGTVCLIAVDPHFAGGLEPRKGRAMECHVVRLQYRCDDWTRHPIWTSAWFVTGCRKSRKGRTRDEHTSLTSQTSTETCISATRVRMPCSSSMRRPERRPLSSLGWAPLEERSLTALGTCGSRTSPRMQYASGVHRRGYRPCTRTRYSTAPRVSQSTRA